MIRILDIKEWKPLSETSKYKELFDSMSKSELEDLHDNFADWILFIYIKRIKRAIGEQRFPVRYPALNKDYAEMKRNKGRLEGFWRNTGYLADNIERWQDFDGTWNIGFRSTEKHPENNQSVLTIAQANEYGTKDGRIPARPLFRPIANIINKSITKFFEEFLEQERPDLYNRVKGSERKFDFKGITQELSKYKDL